MITIPTGDLVGILADVVPFAWPDDDLPTINAVRLEWDGERLHAMATDRYRLGWSTWEPGDADPDEEVQDDLFTAWGGGDDPWRVTLRRVDATELTKVFKLPAKARQVPVTVDHDRTGHRLIVKRSADTGHTAHTMTAEDMFTDDYPDIRKVLADADKPTSIRHTAFNAKWLADFAKVRPRGPLDMRFTKTLVQVSIGERFRGAIMPDASVLKRGADLLRDGAGLVTADS